MTKDELYEENEKLEEDNEKLRTENAVLKRDLGYQTNLADQWRDKYRWVEGSVSNAVLLLRSSFDEPQ